METSRGDTPAASDPQPDPIMILGISERSGTNFLFHLLCLHPECDYGGPLWENYLTLHLQHLVQFADTVYREWNAEWRVTESIGSTDTLLGDLGSGLVGYLNRQRHEPMHTVEGRVRRLVTKTPSVRNLAQIQRIFPGSPLLVLVRDGRAVTESGHRSFDIGYEAGMRNWARSARTILTWLDQQTTRSDDASLARPAGSLLVRYEDLYQDTEQELRRIFRFLQIDADTYDYAAAAALPVVGSSEVKRNEGRLHWAGVAKRADFNPTRRWDGWSAARQYRFAWLAGREAERLGYTVQRPERFRRCWYLWQIAQDLLWHIPTPRRVAARLGRFFRRRISR